MTAAAALPPLREDRLSRFEEMTQGAETGFAAPEGRKPSAFADTLHRVEADALPDAQISRDELLSLCADPATPTASAAACICAWGGMRLSNARSLFRQRSKAWLRLSGQMRAGDVTRAEAYDQFANLRTSGKLKGMGPAYFTKLIYFLMRRDPGDPPPGYIMDQWLGCAINVLADADVVLMNATHARKRKGDRVEVEASYIVSDTNSGAEYERFCLLVEEIARRIEREPDEAERLLMSEGGKEKADWRDYVIRHRRIESRSFD